MGDKQLKQRDQMLLGTTSVLHEKKKEKGWFSETALTGLEKGLDFTKDLILKSKDAKDATEVQHIAHELLEETIKETIKKEAQDAVEKLPFGKVILVTIRLSGAFADGVGQAIDEASADLKAQYDRPLSQDEITEEDRKAIENVCRYQLNSCQKLNDILLNGLRSLGTEALSEITGWAGKKAASMIGDLCGQLAKGLVQRNDLLALASEAAKDAAEAIPEGRRKALGITFNFAASTLVGQIGERLQDPELKKKCKPLIGAASSEESIDVALLKGIIEVMIDGSWHQYAEAVHVDDAVLAMKDLLNEQATVVFQRLSSTYTPVRGSRGSEVAVDGKNLVLPDEAFEKVTQGQNDSPQKKVEFDARVKAVESYRDGQLALARAKQVKYNWQVKHLKKYDPALTEKFLDNWNQLDNKFHDEQNASFDKTKALLQAIEDEFGTGFGGWTPEQLFDHVLNKMPHAAGSNSDVHSDVPFLSVKQRD